MKDAMLFLSAFLLAIALPAADVAPLSVSLPKPVLRSTPIDYDSLPRGPHIDSSSLDMYLAYYSHGRLPSVLAPRGVTNIALRKSVSSSVDKIYNGTLAQITDGKKEAYDENLVEMRKGLQWVQIDLGSPSTIYAIALWHEYFWPSLYRDVIIQLSNDADFQKDVRTVFNNDFDNSSGLGAGQDKEYFETHMGKLLEVKGEVARYARFYSNGSDMSKYNCYVEIEIFGFAGNGGEIQAAKPGPVYQPTNMAPLTPQHPYPVLH